MNPCPAVIFYPDIFRFFQCETSWKSGKPNGTERVGITVSKQTGSMCRIRVEVLLLLTTAKQERHNRDPDRTHSSEWIRQNLYMWKLCPSHLVRGDMYMVSVFWEFNFNWALQNINQKYSTPPPHKSLRMQDASFHITPPLNRIFAMISADGLSLLFPLLLFQMSGFNVTVHILCYNMKMVRKEHTWILHFPSTCGSW